MPALAAAAPVWLLLTRPDCHLCEEFEQALREHLGDAPFVLHQAGVDERGEWRMRYGTRIPVLLDEHNRVLAEGIFDADGFDAVRALAADLS